MVSPACLNKVLGLGGAGGATGSWTAMGAGSTLTGARRALIWTGSTGAGVGIGLGGSATSLIGSRGSSMILRFLGAESSAPFGLPLPRLGTGNSWICSEFSGISCEFSGASVIYRPQEKQIIAW
jgi:hypothetical protein